MEDEMDEERERMTQSRVHLLSRVMQWNGVDLPELVVVVEGVAEVRVAIHRDDMEAGGFTPLSCVRRYVRESVVDGYPYSAKGVRERLSGGDWVFYGRKGVVEQEEESYLLHSWLGSHWMAQYDHLAPLPRIIRKRTKTILVRCDEVPQVVPVDPLSTTTWNGRSPLHFLARCEGVVGGGFERVMGTANHEEIEVMFLSVDAAGRTPLHVATESRNNSFIIEALSMRKFTSIVGQIEVASTLRRVVSAGMLPVLQWVLSHPTYTPLIFNTKTIHLANSRNPHVVTLIGPHTDWTETDCLSVFLSPGKVSVPLLKAALLHENATEEVERKADWKSVGSSLITHELFDCLTYLLSVPVIRKVLVQASLSMLHLALDIRPIPYNMVKILLEAGAVRSPCRQHQPQPIFCTYYNETVRKSALALAMDTHDEKILNLVLQNSTRDELNSACVLFYNTRRCVYGIPPLGYAAVLRWPTAVDMLLHQYTSMEISHENLPKAVLHISGLPWMAEPTLYDADPPETLPEDVWKQVAGYLPARELAVLEIVCKGLHDVVEDGDYWRTALKALEEVASEKSQHYMKLKLKGRDPLPEPRAVKSPKHVIRHAVSKGVFLCNCQCVAPACVTALCKAEPIQGFTTRVLNGVSGYSVLSNWKKLSNPRRWRAIDDDAEILLKLYKIEGGGHTEVYHSSSHWWVFGPWRKLRQPGLQLFVHPVVEVIMVGGGLRVEEECRKILSLEREGDYYGHYYKVGEVEDEDDDMEADEGRLIVSLLGVALRCGNEGLLREAWRLSGASYKRDPTRYIDLKDHSALAEAVRRGNLPAVKLLLTLGETPTWPILLTAIRHGSLQLLSEILDATPATPRPRFNILETTLSIAVLRSSPTAVLLLSHARLFPTMEYSAAVETAAALGRRGFLEAYPMGTISCVTKYREAALSGGHDDVAQDFFPLEDEDEEEVKRGLYSVMGMPCADCAGPYTSDVHCETMPATYYAKEQWSERQYEVLIRSLLGVEVDGEPPSRREGGFWNRDKPCEVYLSDSKTTSAHLFEILGCRGHEHIHMCTRYLTTHWHRVYVKNLASYVRNPNTCPIILVRDFHISNGPSSTITLPIVAKVYHPVPYAPVRFAQVIITRQTADAAEEDPSILSEESRRFKKSWDPRGDDDRKIDIWIFTSPGSPRAAGMRTVYPYRTRYIGVPWPAEESDVSESGDVVLDIYEVKRTAMKKPTKVYYRGEWEVPPGEECRVYRVERTMYEAEPSPSSKRPPPASPESTVVLTLPAIEVDVQPCMTSKELV